MAFFRKVTEKIKPTITVHKFAGIIRMRELFKGGFYTVSMILLRRGISRGTCDIKFFDTLRSNYNKVASSMTYHFEAYAGLLRLSMKGIFNAYVLWSFGKNFILELATIQ